MLTSSQQSLRVFDTICRELLMRLSGDTSERAASFVTEAHQLLATLDSWAHDVPTKDDRAAVISRVLDLHRTAMEYITIVHGKPPEPTPST
jgi:hypothetical protein